MHFLICLWEVVQVFFSTKGGVKDTEMKEIDVGCVCTDGVWGKEGEKHCGCGNGGLDGLFFHFWWH